jgi:urocanate hydratase
MFPHNEALVRWIHLARERVPFRGCRRILWLGYGNARWAADQRAGPRRRAQGADRDRPRSPRRGSSSPNRETEACSTATTRSPTKILNALLNASSGATGCQSTGGGTGIGYRSTPAW